MNSKEQSKETILFQMYVKKGENWGFEELGSLKLRPQKWGPNPVISSVPYDQSAMIIKFKIFTSLRSRNYIMWLFLFFW